MYSSTRQNCEWTVLGISGWAGFDTELLTAQCLHWRVSDMTYMHMYFRIEQTMHVSMYKCKLI